MARKKSDDDNKKDLEKLFKEHDFKDFQWIDPSRDIVVAQWVRMKCMFGCNEYGRNATCPPNTPSLSECEQYFKEFASGAVFHFEKKVEEPEERKNWSMGLNQRLLELERQVFLKGNVKAFVLFMDSCGFCGSECAGIRTGCKQPQKARPGLDAMGIDVYSLVRNLGYPVQVLKDYSEAMNRYALLLVE